MIFRKENNLQVYENQRPDFIFYRQHKYERQKYKKVVEKLAFGYELQSKP